MPKKTASEPSYDKTRHRWKATISASLSKTGNRVRSWHATRKAAREWLDKTTSTEEAAATIPPMLAMEADKARAILEPWNLDLPQAARMLAAALEALGGAGSVLEAAKDYRARYDANHASKPLGEAVIMYLDSRDDLRKSTLDSYKYTLQGVIKPLAKNTLADITTQDLESILADKGATARKMHRRNLGAFWKWASISPRKWADHSTVTDLEPPRTSNDADIEILNPAEVKALLSAAEAENPHAAAAYAIAVFGGVRMAELSRLTWASVGDDNIEIGKDAAKKHSRRLVPICPTLRAWLDATRGDAKDSDSITPGNWLDVSKSVRRRAGWDVSARLLDAQIEAGKMKALPKPTRGEWPANAPRHTCASVQVAIGTPLDDLTFKFGHSGGYDLLRRHYVSRLPKKDALAILAIAPAGVEIPKLKIA